MKYFGHNIETWCHVCPKCKSIVAPQVIHTRIIQNKQYHLYDCQHCDYFGTYVGRKDFGIMSGYNNYQGV